MIGSAITAITLLASGGDCDMRAPARVPSETIVTESGPDIDATKFDYSGHRWLFFSREVYHGIAGGAVHDPDCPCYTQRLPAEAEH